jgi:hypothetical protein
VFHGDGFQWAPNADIGSTMLISAKRNSSLTNDWGFPTKLAINSPSKLGPLGTFSNVLGMIRGGATHIAVGTDHAREQEKAFLPWRAAASAGLGALPPASNPSGKHAARVISGYPTIVDGLCNGGPILIYW